MAIYSRNMAVLHRLPRPVLVASFWIVAIAVGVLALLPASYPLPSTGWDKSNHALAFATMALLGAACWPNAFVRVLIGLAIYGGAIEVAQTFTETRMGEVVDWVADVAGLAIAWAIRAWTLRKRG
jgi:LPXTG-motif cell wall-anchored protein